MVFKLEDKDIIEEDIKDDVEVKSRSFAANAGLFFLELIKLAIIAGLVIGLVRHFLFKPFYVKGQSMEPNYHEKDYLIIDEITYRFREPVRGEVIVFKAPTGEDYYLKRVIGLPGERIKIEKNKIIIYNSEHPQGVVVSESYLDEPTDGLVPETTMSADEYFVLGDNRDASYDSRRFGPIGRNLIVGRAWFRGLPINKAGLLNSPEYKF